MPFGNLAARPNLRPLFGQLLEGRHERLLDRLLAIDASLVKLAERASAYVGVPYRALGLNLLVDADGSSSGIHGGPSGDAGDIWFDISPAGDRLSREPVAAGWVVTSILVVFCSDSPEPKGSSSTHQLACLEGSASTPEAVLDILESHVSVMAQELESRPREFYTMTPHDRLP